MADSGRHPNPKLKVLVFAASLRAESLNHKLATLAARIAEENGATVDLASMRDFDVPSYDGDLEAAQGIPAGAQGLRRRLTDNDAFIISSPEYNGSIPGQLKNALDWASRPFPENVLRYKPCAVIGASTGLFGAVWAQAEVRKALKASGAHVLESELPVGLAESAFTEDGRLADDELTARLHDLLADLVREVESPVEEAA